MKNLVIVESPTKAKTIKKFLGSTYVIKSSFGHIRDLPKNKMGIDVDTDFTPHYLIPKGKKEVVEELKKDAVKAETIYFATDEDREGEAISWHLAETFNLDPKKIKRITFHEITKGAIEYALTHPRSIDLHLVDAQQARRILDRLVGYELSPFLWKKVARGLSAGRVQSVAVRLIVEREREIQAFVSQEYWTLEAIFEKNKETFKGILHAIDGKKLEKLSIGKKEEINRMVNDLQGAAYTITDIQKKQTKRTPPPPFRTSTLQQQANTKFGYSSKATMRIAQELYEGVELGPEGPVGLITYMRTDSTNLSVDFVKEAHAYITRAFGKEYTIPETRIYQKKAKGAQEAHEAIRPTDPSRTPESIQSHLTPQQCKIYDLIWRRSIATQMQDAKVDSTAVDITAKKYLFRATGSIITFEGFLTIYPDMKKDDFLPPLLVGENLPCKALIPEQHCTEPPARYNDASLVKALEERGIGRPSTYAPTISTIEERRYVTRNDQKRFEPTDAAYIVTDLLVEHFPEIIDYDFTAKMEEDLDEIAEGKKEWKPLIRTFYVPFKQHLIEKEHTLSKKELTEQTTDAVCEKCGKPMVIKMGRFGKFMACSGYPECKNTKEVNGNGEEQTTDAVCEKCGKPMAVKRGRFGTFLGCSGYPECKNIKKIEKKTGVLCPKCSTGEIITRRSRTGRTFYGCNTYPACDYTLWSKPTGEKCPECGSLMIYSAKGITTCSNKECKKTGKEEKG